MSEQIQFSVFTKPWPNKSIDELGRFVHWLGFDGIELPVRAGFPVNPENVATELPRAVKTLAAHNVKIFSIAGSATEPMIAACAAAGVPTVRIMAPVGDGGYLASEGRLRAELQALVPSLERHGVRIGVQNHNGRYICNASGLRALLAGLHPRHVGAVWDAAHNALQGEDPELAIDIVWHHLCMVNLKNAVWQKRPGSKGAPAEWRVEWVAGRGGLAPWKRVADELTRRQYRGVVCLTAEYSDETHLDSLIAEDLHFARSLFKT